MVKKAFIFLFITTFFSSCSDYIGMTGHGIRSKRKYKKYLKKRVNPNEVGIKTDVVYKYIYYSYSEMDDTYALHRDSISKSKDLYLHFHNNGSYFGFVYRTTNRELYEKSFDPRAGDLGFVVKKKNGYILKDYGPNGCGHFNNVGFEIRSDTLILKQGSNIGYRVWYYYVEKKVPKEWLNYRPDI